MIELIATTESLAMGLDLLEKGVDQIVMGEEIFGLRLPGYLDFTEMATLTQAAHQMGKQVIVAANAILHNDKIELARPFLKQLKEIGVDKLLVGDTGLIQIMKEPDYYIPYIYDGSVLVTSHGQVNFWAQYGAVGALVAREVPLVELQSMAPQSQLPLLMQIYGASCIHQSKRKLLDNYFNFIEKDVLDFSQRHLFLSEPGKDETHYSIYQDSHGTHIFANKDLNLIESLVDLLALGVEQWYLDGIYTPGQAYVDIVALFVEVRDLIQSGQWNAELAANYREQIRELHPANRELGTGFFLYEADTVQ